MCSNYNYGFCAPTTSCGGGYALILVLFILLVIIGSTAIGWR